MTVFHHHSYDSRRLQKDPRPRGVFGMRMAVFFLCLSMLAALLPALALAEADQRARLSEIVNFQSITLHYAGDDGLPAGAAIPDHTLLKRDDRLVLYYTYEIPEDKISKIAAGIRYHLEVSSHLVLSHLENGSSLTIKTDEGEQQFGKIYADGADAWVIFDPNEDGSGTVLSESGGLSGAYFYLDCGRAADPPEDGSPIDGETNLYALKFENGEQLAFGYAENEPITSKAQIKKDGSLTDKTITWTIDYTPWQNPATEDPVTKDTPFELRDTIDTAIHDLDKGSAEIDGLPIPTYPSRADVDSTAEAYLLVEPSEEGKTVLIFGGTKLKAGAATQGNPAQPLKITYETMIRDELFLPGGEDGQKVTNAVELFAGTDGMFNKLDISGQKTVDIPRPTWLTKTGKTTRHTDGTGSTTDWTVTFFPNGLAFDDASSLTLHDRLPGSSTLKEGSVKVDGIETSAETVSGDLFAVPSIKADGQPVTITYQTCIPETMYDNGTDLGDNTAWFTFRYDGTDYATPTVTTPIGSGDGSGTSGTAPLIKTNEGYDAAFRTIRWTVTINPHKAALHGGTFIDDLRSVGGSCTVDGHRSGLELPRGTGDIDVWIDGQPPAPGEEDLVRTTYDQQVLTINVGDIGAKTITLSYATKVCDPCIFANNTTGKKLKNTIVTEDMVLGSQSSAGRRVQADSTADVNATVLKKNPPVYDYTTRRMKWTVEVDGAGLSMTDVVLTDTLPAGSTYADGSFAVIPEIPGAAATVSGQELTLRLGDVTEKTIVTFETEVDPEVLGFGGDGPILVENEIRMNGNADSVAFAEVSHKVTHRFTDHGLVKSNKVDVPKELIQYEVLVNPFGLLLPEAPSLVDTLDKRLQLDTDTLRFYKAHVSGTTDRADQRPSYTKVGEGQPLKITGYDPAENRFTVRLPVGADSRDAYVLTYTADIIDLQTGIYGNSVHFEGGQVLLGGDKQNNASVGGGGGGGGGGVAARKAGITITKKDSEDQEPLAGVVFTLYQEDLPFAQGTTDAKGRLSFKVKPGAVYELVESESLPGYNSTFGWTDLPDGVKKTENGLLIKAGAAKSELELVLTNEAFTTDLVFCLVNGSGIPMAGERVMLFTSDPAGQEDPVPEKVAEVMKDGTVCFSRMRRGAVYFICRSGGDVMRITVPADRNESPKITMADGTTYTLTKDHQVIDTMTPDQQWTLKVRIVGGDGTAPLAGAAFGLYAEESCQTLVASGSSGSDGILTFAGLIKGQRYWLKETGAPSGHELDPTVRGVSEADPFVTISNTPKTPIVDSGEPDSTDTPDITATPTDVPSDTRIPDETPDITHIPDDTVAPSGTGIPDGTETPDITHIPGDTGIPGDTATPDITHPPDDTATPGGSGISDITDPPVDDDIPSGTGAPRDPDAIDRSRMNEASRVTDTSAGLRDADSLDSPDRSAISAGTSQPEPVIYPGGPGSGDPSGGRDVPQTGDTTPRMVLVFFLSGISLVLLASYRKTYKKIERKRV